MASRYRHAARSTYEVIDSEPHAAPAHVEVARRQFIDLLTREQLAMLGEVSRTVLAALP